MLARPPDTVLTETLERIRRAELACLVHPVGTPEHVLAVERLRRATRQLRRLSAVAAQADPGRDAG